MTTNGRGRQRSSIGGSSALLAKVVSHRLSLAAGETGCFATLWRGWRTCESFACLGDGAWSRLWLGVALWVYRVYGRSFSIFATSGQRLGFKNGKFDFDGV